MFFIGIKGSVNKLYLSDIMFYKKGKLRNNFIKRTIAYSLGCAG